MKAIKSIKSLSVLIIFLLFMANLILFNYGYQLLQPVAQDNIVDKVIEIKSGTSLTEISYKLHQEKLIQSPLAFKVYVRIKGLARQIQAGHYKLNQSMSVMEITDKLIKGKIVNYKITIPEGATIIDIADLLAQKGLNKEEFLNLARKTKLDFLPKEVERNYNLEGFLFPETYKVSYGSSEREVIEIMLKEFNEKLSPLREKIKDSGYSLYQIITIASLIQAEAKFIEEGPLIASVIYNRLNKGMKLQLDATVQYSLPKHKSRLLYSDLEVESSYNTYQNLGLPPGPINNPGIEAIKAALNSKDTDYLYYVANEDGKHIFTKSYQEHLQVQRRNNR